MALPGDSSGTRWVAHIKATITMELLIFQSDLEGPLLAGSGCWDIYVHSDEVSSSDTLLFH